MSGAPSLFRPLSTTRTLLRLWPRVRRARGRLFGATVVAGTTDLMLVRTFLASPLTSLVVNGATLLIGLVVLLDGTDLRDMALPELRRG